MNASSWWPQLHFKDVLCVTYDKFVILFVITNIIFLEERKYFLL